ncbi:MAG: hypothetical protein UX72_C0040G0013 [Parcubacteria group bacterium GW2011_GWA2_47_10]|nr:MAG: hypothetical protein UX72_C0040G0013 [Parcubacteria group bacterium GW2011_GWA2_47_10]
MKSPIIEVVPFLPVAVEMERIGVAVVEVAMVHEYTVLSLIVEVAALV